MLVAKDLEGNVAETLSEPFSITDNTAPLVSLSTLTGTTIGSTMDIQWSASDNISPFSSSVLFSGFWL